MSVLASAAEDKDPDSSMLSSSSNEEDHVSDQNLFDDDQDHDQNLGLSSSHQPATPKNTYVDAITAPGELSPPLSQSASQRIPLGIPYESADTFGLRKDQGESIEEGTRGGNIAGTAGSTALDSGSSAGEVNGQAYISQEQQASNEEDMADLRWKSKRAQEEYFRVAETMADRDFSLREFGDLFDNRPLVREPL